MDATISRPLRSLRGTRAGDGTVGPIEERIGRRLVRVLDPEGSEGRGLLLRGEVELLGPDGPLGRISPDEARALLRARLERLLADPAADADPALQEGLRRLARA